jgi:endoribonuclease Dicer
VLISIPIKPEEMEVDGTTQESSAELSFARSYQLEALERAIKQNTIVFLETGSGKTLISIMLLRRYAYLLRKPSTQIAVFLVPTVVLVKQQAEEVEKHTDLKVGKYWGEMGVDFWNAAIWQKEQSKHEVLVMTPMILLDALRASFIKIQKISILIFDECHNAKGKHAYACIMKEFYHRLLLQDATCQLPRIFGMTASPVKTKAKGSSNDYWKDIHDLENLMHSKIYTCENEAVLAEYIRSAVTVVKEYDHMEVPYSLSERLSDLASLREKYELFLDLNGSSIPETSVDCAKTRLKALFNTFTFCTTYLGVWLALKAAESLSLDQDDLFSWGKMDFCSEKIKSDFLVESLKLFSSCIPLGKKMSISSLTEADIAAGYLTKKVACLVESLLEYSHIKDLRCIVFVERVITAIVIQKLLEEMLPERTGWKTEYTAGNSSVLQSQSRKKQISIVDDFRKGNVNIIVATSMLEEGLDVQSCNLVIRFDPSATVCSFIQSRGRARMQNSVFLLLVQRGDDSAISQVQKYSASGCVMRQKSLEHASTPCEPINSNAYDRIYYEVESTGARVNLLSSVQKINQYCFKLPSDGYFKPSPRCEIDVQSQICTLYLPKSCPIQCIKVQYNDTKILKQFACLKACKKTSSDWCVNR